MSSPQQGYRRNSFSVFPRPESQSSNAPRGSIAGQQQHRQQQQNNPRRSQSQDRSTAQRNRPVTPANWPLGNHIPVSPPQQTDAQDVPVQHPSTANELPDRTGTAFSEANTLVRSRSGRSRSSIAKYGLHEQTGGSGATALRSIFPTYDHSVPLAEQHYAPVHMGPTRLPRAVISRQSVYEEPEVPSTSREAAATTHGRGHDVGAAMPTSPARPAPVRGRWPLRIQTQPAPVVPTPSSTADLKNLWRVANGWKASASEGRVFCLKFTRQDDAPVYTLSSSTAQPFWKLRLDPTSASAYVNLTRHDPGKPYRQPSRRDYPSSRPSRHSSSGATSRRCSSSSSNTTTTTTTTTSDTKHWYEALTTTLQQTCRREPARDGLVALLIPTAASKMAAQRANDAASVQAASNECARLVWDDDTSTHYLVHNALERPFCVTVDRNPAYSRVEYTLEHDESPAHIAKLTRDGTGAGWLELDTRVASQIPACYILDVVVTALLLAALADEDRHCPSATLGTFAPPPAAAAGEGKQRESSWPSLSRRWSTMMGVDSHSSKKTKTKTKNKENKSRNRMEEFELDLESQTESLGKERGWSRCSTEQDREKDKLPLLARVVVKLTKGLFALVLCVLTVLFKCVGGVLKALHACLGSKY
ncbi:hypothetical protein E4U54_004846 [Claviceps lovelessii]|nr:hypothetical protein E4U54_004846 [Claviceps lovelessii]